MPDYPKVTWTARDVRDVVPNLERIGHEWHGACPYPSCDADTDGFWVKDDGTFSCRKCNNAGRSKDLYRHLLDKMGLSAQREWPPPRNARQYQGSRRRARRRPVEFPPAKLIEHPKITGVALDGPDVLTVADVLNAALWIPGHRGPHWQQGDFCVRHSLDPDRGGVKVARFGGKFPDKGKTLTARPWRTYQDALDGCKKLGGDWHPTLCLSGDKDCPYPFKLCVIDADYKPQTPDDDPDGEGRRQKEALRAACLSLGMPLVASSGGEGFHALFVSEVDEAPRKLKKKIFTFNPELFTPDSRQMVTLRADLGLDAKAVIPRLRLGAILDAASGETFGRNGPETEAAQKPAPEDRMDEATPDAGTKPGQDPEACLDEATPTECPHPLDRSGWFPAPDGTETHGCLDCGMSTFEIAG